MNSRTTLVCYGCSRKQIEIIHENLPSDDIEVIEADCVTNVISTPHFMVIIDPAVLNKNELRILTHFFSEEECYCPVLTAECPYFEEHYVGYQLLDKEKFIRNIRSSIADNYTERKTVENYHSRLAESCMVIKAIINKPYISTEALSGATFMPKRSVLRHIYSLNCAGEWIEYDEKQGGWFVPSGKSMLTGDTVAGSLHTEGKTEFEYTPFTLVDPERKWNAWYSAAMKFCSKWVKMADPGGAWLLIWYTIAVEITECLNDNVPAEIPLSILSDLMLKLTGCSNQAEEIMTDRLKERQRFTEVMREYNLFQNGYDCGLSWMFLRSTLDSGELFVLTNEALPFWCWLRPYTRRYVECWLEMHGHRDWYAAVFANIDYGSDYIDAVRELINMYPSVSLNALTQTNLISSIHGLGFRDMEGLFFMLLGRGMPFDNAYKLAHRIGHFSNIREDQLLELHSYFSDEEMPYLNSGEYIPPRARGIHILLKTVDLAEK